MASKKTTKKAETPIDQHETFVSLQKSFADSQLSVEEKNARSHRGNALRSLLACWAEWMQTPPVHKPQPLEQ